MLIASININVYLFWNMQIAESWSFNFFLAPLEIALIILIYSLIVFNIKHGIVTCNVNGAFWITKIKFYVTVSGGENI